METTLLKTLGQIAGIGGLSLGLILIIFREVLKKNIYPTLNRIQAYRILRLIILLVWSIAIIGILAWLITSPENSSQKESKTDNLTSYLRGVVVNSDSEPVPDAIISIDALPSDSFITTSDGGFYIEKVPRKIGDRVRLYVRKSEYKLHNEYVSLPGPVTILLVKDK
jgi:hypothetical protein